MPRSPLHTHMAVKWESGALQFDNHTHFSSSGDRVKESFIRTSQEGKGHAGIPSCPNGLLILPYGKRVDAVHAETRQASRQNR